MKYIQFLFISIILFFIVGCSTNELYQFDEVGKAKLQKSKFKKLQNWENQDFIKSFENFQKSCQVLKKKETFKKLCKRAKNVKNAKLFFETNFTPFKIVKDRFNDKGLITGYYEPLLYGSLTKTEKFKYPLYGLPNDMLIIDLSKIYPELKNYRLRGRINETDKTIIPYYSREEIEKNGLENAEIICYVDNKIDLFFLQVQGSGKVQLKNGQIINIGYSNQNGYPYYSIGKYLISKKYVPRKDISLQSIRKWLNSNPSMIDEVLNYNRSYVFFNKQKKGATGSLGIELTAENSIAIDPKYVQLGLPVFVSTTYPNKKKLDILAFAQDTGGAIKGEIRADIFFGFGKNAENIAGKMKQRGTIWVLVPNLMFK